MQDRQVFQREKLLYHLYHRVMGDEAIKPANAPTAADPKAISPSGIVDAVFKFKINPPMMVNRTAKPRKPTTKRKIYRSV
jgi:hypothetical protein